MKRGNHRGNTYLREEIFVCGKYEDDVDPFERSGRAGVALGFLLVLIAAAHVHSFPSQHSPLRSDGLPPVVSASFDSDSGSAADVNIVHDEPRFITWTTDTGLQLCLNVAFLASSTEASSLWNAAPGDLISDRVCGPAGTLPADTLTLFKGVTDPQDRRGIVVFVLPDHYAAYEWSITVDYEPTRTIKGTHTFVLEYGERDWPAGNRIVVGARCQCGSYQQSVDLS